jgi:hypothetical protein
LERLTGVMIGLGMQVEVVRIDKSDTSPPPQPTQNQWAQTLSAVIQSVETRMSGEPGGREYLDFLPGFFKSIPRTVGFPGAPGFPENRPEEAMHGTDSASP